MQNQSWRPPKITGRTLMQMEDSGFRFQDGLPIKRPARGGTPT